MARIACTLFSSSLSMLSSLGKRRFVHSSSTVSSNFGTTTSQPSQNFLRGFKSGILGMFPIEEHL